MTTPTLKQLRYFAAVAQHGHFGHAADACAVSQPALSMQIKYLEDILGVTLFERGGRSVRLTEFGEELLARARGILTSVEELSDLARAARGRLAGALRIGVIPTIAPYLLPALIRELTAVYPQIDFHVRETITPRLVDELSAGQLDAAILALPLDEPALTEVALFAEELVLVRSKAEAGQPVPSREALRDMRLLLLEEGHCFRDQALSYCDVRDGAPASAAGGSSLSTLVQLVGAGLGVTLIPEMAVEVETRSAPVCVTRFAEPRPMRTIGMVWRNTHPLAAQLQELSGHVREVGKRGRVQS